MAEQPQSGAVSAAFPAPPPFYKHFTPENLARLQEIQSSAASQEGPTTEDTTNAVSSLDLAALPLELRYLIPPLPPTGQYRSLNTVEDVWAFILWRYTARSGLLLTGHSSSANPLDPRPSTPQNPNPHPPPPLPFPIAYPSHQPCRLPSQMGRDTGCLPRGAQSSKRVPTASSEGDINTADGGAGAEREGGDQVM